MANEMATGWLQAFLERRRPTGFLSSQFTVKPGGIFYGETVEYDIKRYTEAVAFPVTRGTTNFNDASIIDTKELKPPNYGEAFPTDVEDLLERSVGIDPYSDAGVEFAGKLVGRLMDYFMEGYDMIVRGVEIQASQILQTGELSLTDNNGAVRFTADFRPKATHFPTVSTAWSNSGSATPILDLLSLFEVIRGDGKVNPDIIIMGERSLRNALQITSFQDELDNRRIDTGEINPRMMGSGATLYGFVWIGSYRAQIWTYPEGYTHPQTGAFTKYVLDDKVIVTSSETRLDRLSAKVPLPLGPDPRVAALMPGRLVESTEDLDVTPNLYPTPDGRQIMAEILSRTLLAPIQIDGFGCLDTNP